MDKLGELIASHPKLFRGSEPAVPSELPAGWYELVHMLCLRIEALMKPEPERFKVIQIKEKFGGLRFYFWIEGSEDVHIDLQYPEVVQTLVRRADGPSVMSQVRSLVDGAERRSTEICQLCGAHGTHTSRGGWLSTLCEQHAREREEEDT